ncbi:MAG: transglutaminase domain-containing protein [Bacteroidota bacterium]
MRILPFSCLLLCIATYAQDTSVDAKVRAMDLRTKNTKKLSDALTSPFETAGEKIRAIYFWVGTNISYDHDLYNNRLLKRKLAQKKLSKRVKRTLRKRRAICGGYSELFQVLAHAADIDCEVIEGYSKTKASDIGRRKRVDHAWNVAKVNDEWRLYDVTWGRSYLLNPSRFPEISDPNFDADPLKFNYSHLPTTAFWGFNTMAISKEEFQNLPIVHTGFYLEDFALSEDSQLGIIDVQIDEPVQISFSTSRRPIYQRVLLGKEFFDAEVTKNEDESFTFEYAFSKKGNYYATIYLNLRPTLTYLVRVK